MRLLLGMDGFFYLSFPGKQVYWMVAENGRFESMKQKKEREKEISQWPWISMLPFGILAGYWGDKEVRITAISEYGFQTRLAAPATAEQKNAPWELAFYDQKTASYQRILLRDATFLQEKEEDFDVVYTFATEQEDYRNAVQHLALQYSQYIRWKMEDDDAALAEQMTGYPAEQDAFHLESLEEQKKVWFSGITKETFVALQNSCCRNPGSRLSWRSNWTGRNGIRRIFRWKVGCFLMLIFGKTRFQIRRFFTRTGSI